MTPEQLDYQQTCELIRSLTDVRFKLLALVPTISGAAVAVVGKGARAAELLAVGLVGLVATAGILLYEQRNTQLVEAAVLRAHELEGKLGLAARPVVQARLGVGLVYSAAIGGWTYLVAWGGLRALDLANAQKTGGAIAILTAALVLFDLLRAGTAATPKAQKGVVAHGVD